jgi:hypothetical protein
VALKEVMTVLNSVYGASQSLVTDCDENFPLQQKVLVSTLLLILKKGQNKDITVGKVQNTPYLILLLDIRSVLVGRHITIVTVIS